MDQLVSYLPTLGAPGVLLLVVVMVLRGQLVPRRTFDDKVREAEALWETVRTQQATTGEQAAQMGQLTAAVRQLVAVHSPPYWSPNGTGGRHHRDAA